MNAVDGGAIYSFLQRQLFPHIETSLSVYFTRTNHRNDGFEISGCAYRHDGSLILESCRTAGLGHWRHVDPLTIDRTSAPIAERHYEKAIFAGHFFPMWGHFLLETLATAYAAEQLPSNIPVIFAAWSPLLMHEHSDLLWKRVEPLLRAAGWGDRHLIHETGPFSADVLFTPERLSVYCSPLTDTVFAPEMRQVYTNIRQAFAKGVEPKRRIFLRRPLHHGRYTADENAMYELLAQNGFEDIVGSELAVDEQVKVFAEAYIVVGFQGSALHNAVFSKPGTQIFELADQNSYLASNKGHLNSVQVGICRLLEQDLALVQTREPINGGAIPPEDVIASVLDHLKPMRE